MFYNGIIRIFGIKIDAIFVARFYEFLEKNKKFLSKILTFLLFCTNIVNFAGNYNEILKKIKL
jgi:hypothetical protein